MTREARNRFRDAPMSEALELVTTGFELETQETEGETAQSMRGSDEIDHERADEAIDSEVNEALREPQTWLDNWDDMPKWLHRMTNTRKLEVLRLIGCDRLHNAVEYELMDERTAESIEESVREAVRENFDYNDYMESRTEDEACEEMNDRHTVKHCEWSTDQSVKGFEIRTVGGLTPWDFWEAAESVFDLDHKIDKACSFHVHLKVADVEHGYGETMQKALTEYLIEHVAEAPASVQERWQSIRNRTHIQPGVKKEKYSFVHKHGQGTWEFRCFGNVTNADDAMKCLELAIRAMQYAYRVVSGQSLLYTDTLGGASDRDQWCELCKLALESGESMTTTLRERRDYMREAA